MAVKFNSTASIISNILYKTILNQKHISCVPDYNLQNTFHYVYTIQTNMTSTFPETPDFIP